MIKHILLLLSVLWLVACSGSASTKSYYQLPPMVIGNHQKSSGPSESQIQIVGVNIADYLNGAGIVYQTNDVQYIMAANNLWASGLQQQLLYATVENLNEALPGWLVTSQSVNGESKQLTVNVTAFQGRYDGAIIVRGDWVLMDGAQILTKSFDIQLSQPDDGYDSLVRTLAKAWKLQNDAMAKAIVAGK